MRLLIPYEVVWLMSLCVFVCIVWDIYFLSECVCVWTFWDIYFLCECLSLSAFSYIHFTVCVLMGVCMCVPACLCVCVCVWAERKPTGTWLQLATFQLQLWGKICLSNHKWRLFWWRGDRVNARHYHHSSCNPYQNPGWGRQKGNTCIT